MNARRKPFEFVSWGLCSAWCRNKFSTTALVQVHIHSTLAGILPPVLTVSPAWKDEFFLFAVTEQFNDANVGTGNKLHLVLDQLKDLQLEEVLCGRVPKGAPSNFFQQKDSKGDKRDPAKVVREAFETAHHILEDNGIGTLDQWRQLSKERLHKLRLDPLVIDIVDEHIQHVGGLLPFFSVCVPFRFGTCSCICICICMWTHTHTSAYFCVPGPAFFSLQKLV